MTDEGDAPTILIVDDDQALRETLADFLTAEGYAVEEAESVSAARARIEARAPALVLLDLNMPGGDGLPLAAELRARTSIPIIIVSGKGSTIDRVVGLEVGADDYLAKPFELRELLARIRAVLRRSQPVSRPEHAAALGRRALFDGGFALDCVRRALTNRSGAAISLTAAECNLLQAFLERPNRVLSRDTIADLTKREDWEAFDRSIDTQISRLRKKLEEGGGADLIQTVRGEGYMLASAVEWRG